MADYMVTRTKSGRSRNDQDGAVARQRLWSTPRSGSLNNYASAYTPTGFDAVMLKRNAPKYTMPKSYDYLAEYQKAMDAANAKNEARDKELRAGYQEREQQANDLIASQGVLAKKDLEEAYRQQGAAQNARLTGLGLGNTSVVGAMQQGLLRRRGDAMTGLNESLDRNRLNVLSQMSGDRLGQMERRNDVAPDLNLMAQLASQGGGQYGYQPSGGYQPGGSGVFGAPPAFMGSFGMPQQYMSWGGGYGGYGGGGQQPTAPAANNSFWANYRQQQLQNRAVQKQNAMPYGSVNLGATSYSPDRYSSYV